jgi:Flp pilus assembly protein TadD
VTRARLAQVGIALACAAVAAYLATGRVGESRLERARDDVAHSRYKDALAELRGAGGQAAPRVPAVRAAAYLGLGDLRRAAREYDAAIRHAPNDWALQRDSALVLLALGRRGAARERMERALALNPRMPVPPGFRLGARPRQAGPG